MIGELMSRMAKLLIWLSTLALGIGIGGAVVYFFFPLAQSQAGSSDKIVKSPVVERFDHKLFINNITGPRKRDLPFSNTRSSLDNRCECRAIWQSTKDQTKEVLARIQKEVEAVIRQNGGEVTQISPPQAEFFANSAHNLYYLAAFYSVSSGNTTHDGWIRVWCTIAASGKQFSLVILVNDFQ